MQFCYGLNALHFESYHTPIPFPLRARLTYAMYNAIHNIPHVQLTSRRNLVPWLLFHRTKSARPAPPATLPILAINPSISVTRVVFEHV